MTTLQFGWHMPSFPVDGSDGATFIAQIDRTLARVQDDFTSVWVDDHLMPWAEWQPNDTPYLECLTTISYFAARYPALKFGSSVFGQSPFSSRDRLRSASSTPSFWQRAQ